MTRLVLASASPRRRDLLVQLGLDLEVRPADIDESVQPGEDPTDYVRRVAREKAETIASALPVDGDARWAVLGADTAVVAGDEILGKPADDADAARMLRLLADAPHSVSTGVAVVTPWATVVDHETSAVTFSPMSDDDIAWYVGTTEPRGKAGAIALQEIGSLFVERIDGSASSIVGLPLPLTRRLLADVGIDLLALARS